MKSTHMSVTFQEFCAGLKKRRLELAAKGIDLSAPPPRQYKKRAKGEDIELPAVAFNIDNE